MSELSTRSFYGALFVVVVVAAIYYSLSTCFALLMFIGAMGLKEYFELMFKGDDKANFLRRMVGISIGFITIIYETFIYNLFNFDTTTTVGIASVCVSGLLIFELYQKSETPFENIGTILLGVFYIGIPIALFSTIIFTDFIAYKPNIFMGIFLLIWSNDSFAYLIGSNFGKNKLFPRISPGKTWEGTIGGIICTGLIAILVAYFFKDLTIIQWFGLAIIVGAFGTIGDLIESMLKRSKNVKDSGKLMPGHGGVLDRFDSFIFVLPFVWAYFHFFINN